MTNETKTPIPSAGDRQIAEPAPLYFVECDFGEIGRAFVEADRDRMSRTQVVRDIASGQIENVLTVLEIFEDEGNCRNITEDIAIAVREYLHKDWQGCPGYLRDFIDHYCGPGTADELDTDAGLAAEAAE